MFSTASLLIGTFLALSITASAVEVRNSPITLPMTRRLKSSNGTNPVQRDDAGIYLDSFQTLCCISVGVGIPPTYYDLIVDTGSAITWIGADIDNPYRPTDTSYNTKKHIQRTYGYGSAFFGGTLFTDTLSFENGLTVSTMPIGVASESKGMEFDGILGIGPKILSRGILKNAPTKPLSTITDRLFLQGEISQRLVGLYFQPSSKNKDDSGVLTFGGVVADPELNIGKIAYVTTTARPPSSGYWGIDQSITYGNTEILGVSAGIVDCGATFITIASDAFEKYKAVTGANFDRRTKLLSITPEKYGALQPLDFHIGYQTYSLVPNAQIWPRHLNSRIGGVSTSIYLVFKSEPTGIIAFSLGYVFLQRFYSVFDSTRSCVGFATTGWTDAITN
ncbi:aspartic peptidase domain-containing protein [Suillus spraguei]|nr:aspartic peptidase domain-containing protein [Suillus spraguei]